MLARPFPTSRPSRTTRPRTGSSSKTLSWPAGSWAARCIRERPSRSWRSGRPPPLRTHGARPGDRTAHYFTDNRLEDICFRLGAALVGTVPVTINWQSDDVQRAASKVRRTRATLALVDEATPAEFAAAIRPVRAVDAARALAAAAPLAPEHFCGATTAGDDRFVIFTSGTTGEPKGVRLTYEAYDCNRRTFEAFLECAAPDVHVDVVATNPLHHTNSTAMVDWACRRPRAALRLLQRYTTQYWGVVVAAACGLPWEDVKRFDGEATQRAVARRASLLAAEPQRVVCPLVARHVDFLESLCAQGTLPVDPAAFRSCVGGCGVVLLLGSAPVGPTTVKRLEKWCAQRPTVRFGSTETCLQVCGTPLDAPLAAFERGWAHAWRGEPCAGYYIGRAHAPHTEAKVVRSVDRASQEFLVACGEGEPGFIVARGRNVFAGYVGEDEATAAALEGGWYLNLGDVGYTLGGDLYWQSRDSAMLIKGGSNYSYEQINQELSEFLAAAYFGGDGGACAVAVVGLRLDSEHDDACCCTIELKTDLARSKRAEIEIKILPSSPSRRPPRATRSIDGVQRRAAGARTAASSRRCRGCTRHSPRSKRPSPGRGTQSKARGLFGSRRCRGTEKGRPV